MTRTILLADDSVTIQKVVELTFMDQDYQIVAVSDGSTAMARLLEFRPDLLIADVHMPGADGYEVCRRSKATYPGVPVLLLVGTFEHFDDEAAAAAGAESHLKKPFDSQDLLHQVEALIARASREAAAAPAAQAPPVPVIEESPVMDLEPPGLTEEEVTSVSFAAFEIEPEPPPTAEQAASTPFPLGGGFGEVEPVAAPQVSPPGAHSGEPVFDDTWGTMTPPSPDLQVSPPAPAAAPPGGLPAEAMAERPAPRRAAAPAFEAPAFEAPAFEAPAFEAPAFEDPWGVGAMPPAAEPPSPPATEPAIEAFKVETPAFEPSGEPEPAREPAAEVVPPSAISEEAAPAVGIAAAEPAEAPIPEEAMGGEPIFEEPIPAAPAMAAPVMDAPAVDAPAVDAPAVDATAAEPELPGEPTSGEPVEEEEPTSAGTAEEEEPEPMAAAAAGTNGLSDADVDRIARRVVEMAGDATLREVAWEVVPDLAEVIIKERIRELESQVE